MQYKSRTADIKECVQDRPVAERRLAFLQMEKAEMKIKIIVKKAELVVSKKAASALSRKADPVISNVTWTLDHREDRTFSAPGQWRSENEFSASASVMGQLHVIYFTLFNRRFDQPVWATLPIGEHSEPDDVKVEYSARATPDENLPKGEIYTGTQGQVDINIEFANGIGRARGVFRCNCRAATDERNHTLYGYFDIPYPYP